MPRFTSRRLRLRICTDTSLGEDQNRRPIILIGDIEVAAEAEVDLSTRQRQVLSLIDRRLTIKEMASELGISEGRVNQHIDTLKRRLAVNTHRELAERYRHLFCHPQPGPLRESTGGNPQLPAETMTRPNMDRVSDGELALADVHAFSIEAPWARTSEPKVVPPVLDGKHAVSLRLAAVVLMVFGILASLVLAITAAMSLSEAVGSRPDKQLTS